MTFPYTPKKRSRLELGVDSFIWFGLACLWLYVIYHHGQLPDTIVTHFDAIGNANSYGSKDNIFVFPLILTVVIAFLKYLSQFPQYHNYTIKVTQETAPKLFQINVSLRRYLCLVLIMVFSAITYRIIDASNKNSSKLSLYFLPLVILAILAPVGIGIYKMAKIK